MPTIPTDLISAKAAANLLGLHVSTIYRMREDGRLRGYRVGGSRWRYSRADVAGLVQEVGAEEPVSTRAEDEGAASAALARMRAAGRRV